MRLRLAQLERARREFIANASHELRTPIFSLGGFLELIADEELDEDTRARVPRRPMREQVARLTKLATDLLDLSRLDAGRIRLEREPLDLGSLAQAVADEFEPLAQAQDHTIEVEVDGSADRRSATSSGRSRSGGSCVENAIVHTPPGTPVRMRGGQDDGRARLSVEDEGPGIPPASRRQVFERFYRVDGGRRLRQRARARDRAASSRS